MFAAQLEERACPLTVRHLLRRNRFELVEFTPENGRNSQGGD
jgi:hypothetical protein